MQRLYKLLQPHIQHVPIPDAAPGQLHAVHRHGRSGRQFRVRNRRRLLQEFHLRFRFLRRRFLLLRKRIRRGPDHQAAACQQQRQQARQQPDFYPQTHGALPRFLMIDRIIA